VLRYIERNPVRAGLVASAIDWPWSSLRLRLSGRAGKLAALPVTLPAGWLGHVNAPQTAGEVAAVRRGVNGGRLGRPRRVPVGQAVTVR
jgi:putative transposase